MRNRTVIIATNAGFIANILMQIIVDNGLKVFVVDNDEDLAEMINIKYPKFVFIESCFHGNGTDLYVHKLHKRNKFLKIVIWTVYELKPRFAARFIEAGADSFISLRDKENQIKQAIDQISYGHDYYPADVEAAINDEVDKSIVIKGLTFRELEILKMSASGKTNEEICKVLKLKLCTVKSHKYNLYKKCGGNTLLEVLSNGLDKGFITNEDIFKSNEKRTESREQRTENREQRTKNKEQRIKNNE